MASPSDDHRQPSASGAASLHPEMSAFLKCLGVGLTPFDPSAIDVVTLREANVLSRAILDVGEPPLTGDEPLTFSTSWGTVPARLFRPRDSVAGPALIYLHGGGWTIGSVATHRRLIVEYAQATGIPVIALDYALAPEHPFPAALYQCVSCLGQIRLMSRRLDLDPSRIAIGGDSAGGNLAVATALACKELGVPPPAAVLSSYGVFDAPFAYRSYTTLDRDDMLLTAAKMAWFWDNYAPTAMQRQYPLAVPLRAELESLPPTYLTVAEVDILIDENLAFADKARRAGVPIQTDVCDGTVHGFVEGVGLFETSRQAVARQCAWLKDVLD